MAAVVDAFVEVGRVSERLPKKRSPAAAGLARGVLSFAGPLALPSRRLLLLATGLLVAACLSPTLPLPPPSDPTISGPDSTGTVMLAGTVSPSAWVLAINQNTNLGYFQVTSKDGAYDFPIKATVGDSVVIWYRLNGEDSEPLYLTIPQPKP